MSQDDVTTMDPWELLGQQSTSAEAVKAVDEADLIPRGKYEGQIHDDFRVQVDDRETFPSGDANPMFGKAKARLHVELFDAMGGPPRHVYADATAVDIRGRNGQPVDMAKWGALLAKATDTIGDTFAATLKSALGQRLEFEFGNPVPAKGEYKARNRLVAIRRTSPNGSGY